MNDDQIINKGGTEDDIEQYANQNGADLTKLDAFKDRLIRKISNYIVNHPNPYNQGIEEKTYWTMTNLMEIVSKADSLDIVNQCQQIYDRFKFYYI